MSTLLETAKQAVSLALKKGANDASATATRSRDVEIGWRDGKVEKVSEATTRGLSIALYVDSRYSAVATSDLRPDALEKFVEDAIAMARTLSKDPARGLADPKLYEGRPRDDLQLADPAYGEYTAEMRRARAKELEDAARAVPGSSSILSVSTSVWDSSSQSARVTSNGFEGEREGTSYWMSANVSCKDADGRRPESSDYAGTRFWKDLPPAAEVGARATRRTLDTLGAKKIESAVLPIIVENRVAGRLIGSLLGPLGGRALQQKQSFMEGQLGKSVGSKLLTITDDPLIVRGFGSRLYDGDGIAAKKMPVFESGVLKSYYIDVYYGRKLQVAPTTGGSSNLVFPAGKKALADLLKDTKEAVLVTGFLGGNSNATTGDFSFGIQGFRVRKGERAEAIVEMNISGNQKDLWKKLSAVGSDPWAYSSVRTPTLVFDGIQIAGL